MDQPPRRTIRIVAVAAGGAWVGLVVFVSSQLTGGFTAFVGAVTAVVVMAVTAVLVAGHPVEWVVNRPHGGSRAHEPRSLLPNETVTGPCSLCGVRRIRSGALWVCPRCDVGALS